MIYAFKWNMQLGTFDETVWSQRAESRRMESEQFNVTRERDNIFNIRCRYHYRSSVISNSKTWVVAFINLRVFRLSCADVFVVQNNRKQRVFLNKMIC